MKKGLGLSVEYNGKHYVLNPTLSPVEYAVGELVCDLARVDLSGLKEILVHVDGFSEPADRASLMNVVLNNQAVLMKNFTPVAGEIVYKVFLNCAINYFNNKESQNIKWIQEITDMCNYYHINDIVFSNTDYNSPGNKTVGQLLLTVYAHVIYDHMMLMHFFEPFMKTANNKKGREKCQINGFSEMDSYSVQDFEYNILFYNERFNSVYSIESILSLGLFEMAHIYDMKVPIVRCKNCGHWFTPKNRSDTLYCNYPAPGNPEKTCKEIGAQLAWKKKEQTDDVTREYRRIYMRYKMTVNRHPDNREAQEQLEKLTAGIKEWRKKLTDREANNEEFMNWLAQF